MTLKLTDAYKNQFARSFFRDVVDDKDNYYFFAANINKDIDKSVKSLKELRKNILFLKKIQLTDIIYLISSREWTRETVYTEYDDENESLSSSNFYVSVTNDNNTIDIFKCLDNNNGANSTDKPTITTNTSQYLDNKSETDGYIWKYIYTIDALDNKKFNFDNFIPVRNIFDNETEGYNFDGFIDTITVANRGSDYEEDDTNTFIFGDGEGAIVEAVISKGAVEEFDITNNGAGYTKTPEEITLSGGSGTNATATLTTLTSERGVQNVSIENSGSNYVVGDVLTITGDVSASSSATFEVTEVNSGAITGIRILSSGRNYKSYPLIDIIGNEDALSFEYEAIVMNGEITDINNIKVGERFTTPPKVSIRTHSSNIPTTQASIVVTNFTPYKEIVEIKVIENGVGYSQATVKLFSQSGSGFEGSVNLKNNTFESMTDNQTNVARLAKKGTIDNIKITDGGENYTNATIVIDGDGENADATVEIIEGSITDITITNTGENYTYANVTIMGDGEDAEVRAIISPINGHGSNAVKELFASNVGMVVSIDSDRNNYFGDTDITHIGLIKNINTFDNEKRFDEFNGSSLYEVEVETPEVFDDIIGQTIDTYDGETKIGEYKLIARQDSNIYLQEIIPDIKTTYNLRNSSLLSSVDINSIENPEVNTNSGSILLFNQFDENNVIVPVERSTDQSQRETYKFNIEF